ncbi:MAG: hypothetical protein C0596_12040 [Marinilabiliales bacterium]|nr:MAG: hypothetical protein C0596_12040 [Marinilabiliales bacterium]
MNKDLHNIIQKSQVSGLKLNDLQHKTIEQINLNVDNGEYKFENILCPVCSSDDFITLAEKDRYGLENKTVICKSCGLVYTNPRMTQESYNLFYDTLYRKLYVGESQPSDKFFQDQYRHGREIYNFLQSRFAKDNTTINVLEVGCGAGGILSYFKDKSCNVLGVDLGTEYLNYGKDKGLKLMPGSLKCVPESFHPDVIIYSHVFEHILDLKSELELIKEKCSKETLLYIEVPGIKNVHNEYQMNFMNYFQNAHTFNFSLVSLRNLFETNCFKFIRGDDYVKSIFVIGQENSDNDITNDFDSVISYIESTIENQKQYKYSAKNIKFKLMKGFGRFLSFLGLKKLVSKLFFKNRF